MTMCVYCSKREQRVDHPWLKGACQPCSEVWAEAYRAGIAQTVPFMRSEYSALFVAVSDLLAERSITRPVVQAMFAVLTPSLPWKYRRHEHDPEAEPQPG